MTYGRPMTIDELPDTPGKRVLLKILNTPPVDREKMGREVAAYRKKILAEWAEEDKKAAKK